jgi:hypothetical protein
MGEKIKIKEIEGDSEALASLFSTSDCSLSEYLNVKKKPKLNCRTFIGTVVLFLIVLIALWVIPLNCIVWKKILTIVSFTLAICNIMFIQLYWKNTIVTVIGGIGAICLFLIAIGGKHSANPVFTFQAQ